MSSLGGALLARFNGLFPKRGSAARPSRPGGYSAVQYEWARGDLAIFQGALSLAGRRVLDAGCGPGGKTIFFAEQGPQEIVGIDGVPSSIETARRFAEQRGASNASFEVARLEALPFAEGRFDLVLMTDVLEHVERSLLPAVLAEVRRVLEPGGELALYFPPWSSFDASHLYNEIYVPWCHLLFSEGTLLSALARRHRGDAGSLARTIEHYRALNRLTIEEFDRLVKGAGFELRYYHHQTIKGLSVPASFPLEPYLTKRVVAILAKPRLGPDSVPSP